MSPARSLAFHALLAVERGGFASDFLASNSLGLDSRDAGLASQVVFGVLRYRAQLDHLIRLWSGREAKLDPEVQAALRMGIFQIRHLDRVPASAAVNESVELVKRARKRSAAGFVNAVLRKASRDPVRWPSREIELSCPEWLLARWERQFGDRVMRNIAAAALAEPETYVRVPAGMAAPSDLEPTEVPGCYRVAGGETHGLRIQDIGSQTIVPLLDLRAGQSFLDLCAAPGNKTAQALEWKVRAIACDFHLRRAALLKPLGIPVAVVDGTRPLPFRGRFDRILVDAPCSGTGTLDRNPEIKWRLRPADLEDLQARQKALLANALAVLAPGGVLVYSTCSLEREENEAVAGAAEHTLLRIPGEHPGDGFFAAVIKSRQPANG